VTRNITFAVPGARGTGTTIKEIAALLARMSHCVCLDFP
jgi:hypothetical protein